MSSVPDLGRRPERVAPRVRILTDARFVLKHVERIHVRTRVPWLGLPRVNRSVDAGAPLRNWCRADGGRPVIPRVERCRAGRYPRIRSYRRRAFEPWDLPARPDRFRLPQTRLYRRRQRDSCRPRPLLQTEQVRSTEQRMIQIEPGRRRPGRDRGDEATGVTRACARSRWKTWGGFDGVAHERSHSQRTVVTRVKSRKNADSPRAVTLRGVRCPVSRRSLR